jgi:hypothetical protein
MAVDFGRLDAVVDRAGGMPVAYGLRFRAYGRPYNTLHFERGESVHLYVCVDKGYSPVSMALVQPPTPCVQYREVPRDGDECRRLVTDLHGMLCWLAARGRPTAPEFQVGQADPAPAVDNKPPSAGLVLPLLTNEGWRLNRAGAVSR